MHDEGAGVVCRAVAVGDNVPRAPRGMFSTARPGTPATHRLARALGTRLEASAGELVRGCDSGRHAQTLRLTSIGVR